MNKVYKKYDGDSGSEWILNLDGSDGNVYYLWALLERCLGEYAIEESKTNGHIEPPHGTGCYTGYKGVLDYCLWQLTGCPHAIEFRMFGHLVTQVSDYEWALEQEQSNG